MKRDVFICDYVRTPIGRYGGALSSVRTDDLAALPIAALAERHKSLDPEAIDDVIIGCANQAGEDNRNVARMALLLAGLPESVGGLTVNRLCASGMDAVIAAARAISADEADLIVAGGVESMSRSPFVMPKAESAFSRHGAIYDTTIGWRFINSRMQAQYGVDAMPETAENVAAEFGISRSDQDAFAFRSQQRAENARATGRLGLEMVSVEVKGRKGAVTMVEEDEHPRPQTTLDQLAALATPFRDGGTVTAGNASGVNDGAAALLIASETAVHQFNLKPRARILGGASAGVSPRIMGIGPAPATEKLCARLSKTPGDFDVIELNEAFASQALATLRRLGLEDDDPRVNPNGGAIALGHPLGMSGARLVGTAVTELHHSRLEQALATMCVGVGQGVAIALQRV